jgi:hypothetical protein
MNEHAIIGAPYTGFTEQKQPWRHAVQTPESPEYKRDQRRANPRGTRFNKEVTIQYRQAHMLVFCFPYLLFDFGPFDIAQLHQWSSFFLFQLYKQLYW